MVAWFLGHGGVDRSPVQCGGARLWPVTASAWSGGGRKGNGPLLGQRLSSG
jgi:hypothetical protein